MKVLLLIISLLLLLSLSIYFNLLVLPTDTITLKAVYGLGSSIFLSFIVFLHKKSYATV